LQTIIGVQEGREDFRAMWLTQSNRQFQNDPSDREEPESEIALDYERADV